MHATLLKSHIFKHPIIFVSLNILKLGTYASAVIIKCNVREIFLESRCIFTNIASVKSDHLFGGCSEEFLNIIIYVGSVSYFWQSTLDVFA